MQPVWITGGQVYDSAKRTFRSADIRIENGRIARIGKSAAPKRGESRIDAGGLYLLPGLIDCHVHLALPPEVADPMAPAFRSDAEVALYYAWAAEKTLMGGVTTARDVGGWNHVEFAVRKAINEGKAKGPRLFLAGKLLSITTGAVGYYPGMYDVADSPDQVRAAARRQIAAGADLIKVMATGAILSSESEDARAPQFTKPELEAAVEVARDNFKHVAAHGHALRGIRNAVECGCHSIEHGTYADKAVLQLMAKQGTFLVPTQCPFAVIADDPAIRETMPAHLRARLEAARETHRKAVALAYKLGVPIAMGTDAGTPANLHGLNAQECVLMVEEVGMKPADVIHSSTINAARLIRQEENLGSLEDGKFADIVACRDNPLKNITALTRLSLVMKGGTVYRNEI
jgi:imidazolonepropionase-like amidohydrolase